MRWTQGNDSPLGGIWGQTPTDEESVGVETKDMPTTENITTAIGSLFNWYASNATSIFAALILTAIFGELVLRRLRRREIYVRSTLTSWISGAGFLVAKTLLEKLIFVGLAFYIYDNFRLFDLPMGNPLIWLGVLFARDFIYYWVHRTEHTVRFFWASHLIHHSPRNIDMSSAVRIPWMEAMYKPWFSLWMPLLGVHPLVKIALDVFVSTIQQLHHTTAFPGRGDGTYPLVGRIFVTPSTHRVHHGYNPEYLDKNFGAVFIFWDKMFGTYAPEIEPVRFGVGEVDAVDSPADAFVGGYKRLWDNMRAAGSPKAALAIAAGRP